MLTVTQIHEYFFTVNLIRKTTNNTIFQFDFRVTIINNERSVINMVNGEEKKKHDVKLNQLRTASSLEGFR